jgi:hypothetical protein
VTETKIRLKKAVKQTFALATGQTHKVVLIRPSLFVLDVEDAHFNFDRHVLLPDLSETDGSTPVLDTRRVTGLGVIYAALVHADKNAAQGLMVSGHTDAAGAADYNQKLSEDRARSVSFLMRGKRDDWRKLAAATDAVDDYQTILKWQSQRAGWDCDPGPINNKLTKQTQKAIGRFQELYNVEVDKAKEAGADSPFKKKMTADKSVGAETWGGFYDVYMTELMDLLELQAFSALEQRQAKLKPPSGMPDFVGCGEHIPFNPARRNPFEKGSDEHLEGPQKNPPDRRVEIMFFDPGEEVDLVCHPKPGQCKPAECPVYIKIPHRQKPIGIPKGLAVAELNLRLTFVDPEGKVRPLPEGLEVEAKFGDPPDEVEEPAAPIIDDGDLLSPDFGDDDAAAAPAPAPAPAPAATPGADADAETMEVDQEPNEKLGPNGVVLLTIPRKASSLFLRVLAGTETAFVTADPKNLNDQKLVNEKDALDAVAAGRVFFQLPKEFNSRQGYFELPTPPAGVTFKDGAFLNVDNKQTQLGSRETPLEMRLGIHWQHFRFQYFDRWTSSPTCVPQPRTKAADGAVVPPLVLEGVARLIEADRAPFTVEAKSAWAVVAGKDTVHCLGWVRRQILKDQPRRQLPDDKCTARFVTDKLFVRTEGDGSAPDAARGFLSLAANDDPASTPGVDRLRLYDLPAEWRSRVYPARIEGETPDKARPFEKLATTASTLAKPYLVSLDTIVLQAETGLGPDKAVQWDDTKLANRFTLFDNQLRVHKPDPPTAEPYFTHLSDLKPPPAGPVLMDLPPFTRLITRGHHVYDVFDRRTRPFPIFKDFPIGARLAAHTSAGTSTFLPMTLTAAPFEASRANSTNSGPVAIGDSWTGVLRCCGHDKNIELFNVLQYISVSFDFARSFTPALLNQFPLLKKAVPLPAAPPDAQARVRDCLTKVADRWNGRDDLNKAPASIEINNPPTARGQYVAFLSHGALTATDPLKPGDVRINVFKSGRSFMSGGSPEGFWDLQKLRPEPKNGRFTAAHETGHIFSQPDEYLNTDDEPSYDQPNIGEDFRSAGAPYGIDGRAMMVSNFEPRARYLWDMVLFAQQNGHFADAKAAFVKHGPLTFTTDFTPLSQSRVRFPVAQKPNVTPGTLGMCDLFIYSTGHDQFAAGLDSSAKASPYDGFVVVRVKMAWDITTTASYDEINKFMDRANDAIIGGFNTSRPLAVRAKLSATLGGKNVRLRVLFAPRYVCSTFPSGDGADRYLGQLSPALTKPFKAADYQKLATDTITEHGIHVRVRLAGGTAGVTAGAAGRTALVRDDGSSFFGLISKPHFDDDVKLIFGQLVGCPAKRTGTVADFAALVAALSPELTAVVPELVS